MFGMQYVYIGDKCAKIRLNEKGVSLLERYTAMSWK